MIKRPPIVDTLRRTSRQLKSIRKSVAADGYTKELEEIDSLVGVAQQEAERKLSMAESSMPASKDAVSPDPIKPVDEAGRDT